MSDVLEKSVERFTISNDGWKRMNAGRRAADLIREAISNTFDTDDVTQVHVHLAPGFVSVEDNSKTGIPDLSLVTTVFLTDKQDSVVKRGRKGRGLKELISAAEWAEVDTIGFKTTFTEGRETVKSTRTAGTKVSVKVAAWTQTDIEAAEKYLNKVIPPSHIEFYVNGSKVASRSKRISFPAHLKTQTVVDGIQKEIYRETVVEIVNLAKGETLGWVYEMGIPVQQHSTRFHVNILQRIPLNDNRDNIDEVYLSTLGTFILPHLLRTMSAQALKHEWVDKAIVGLGYVEERILIKKLYGDPDILALESWNTHANDVVQQNGFSIVKLNGVSMNMGNIMSRQINSALIIAERIDREFKDEMVPESVAEPTGAFRRLVCFLGQELLGKNIGIEFFKRPKSFTGVQKMAHFKYDIGVIGFNVDCFDFKDALAENVLSTIVHEFAHDKIGSHDEVFQRESERIAGKLAIVALTKGTEMKIVARSKPTSMVMIQCEDCNGSRVIFPQDAHQVKKCVECTKEARRKRAKERRMMDDPYKCPL